jgi:hypothetical protein
MMVLLITAGGSGDDLRCEEGHCMEVPWICCHLRGWEFGITAKRTVKLSTMQFLRQNQHENGGGYTGEDSVTRSRLGYKCGGVSRHRRDWWNKSQAAGQRTSSTGGTECGRTCKIWCKDSIRSRACRKSSRTASATLRL